MQRNPLYRSLLKKTIFLALPLVLSSISQALTWEADKSTSLAEAKKIRNQFLLQEEGIPKNLEYQKICCHVVHDALGNIESIPEAIDILLKTLEVAHQQNGLVKIIRSEIEAKMRQLPEGNLKGIIGQLYLIVDELEKTGNFDHFVFAFSSLATELSVKIGNRSIPLSNEEIGALFALIGEYRDVFTMDLS